MAAIDPTPTLGPNAPPLSAPKNPQQIHTLSIVILCVATASAIGALWMIMGFVVRIKPALL